jgi:uncharacterized membrane protein HdeD (DUF308 family)
MLRQHWRGIRNAGIALLVLGAVAVVLPLAAALAIDLLLGWLLLLGGAALSFQAFRTSPSTRFWWQLGIGVLNTLIGLLLLVNPMQGVLTLTVLLSVLFLVEGSYKVALALPLRAVRGWVWLLTSGLVSLLLGVLILTGLPGTAAWVLGLMVGINLLFTGFVLLSLARSLRPGDQA